MSELWRLSATELAARIKSRDVSAREAAQSALARLDAVNPAINAIVEHRPEAVLEQADRIDRAIARGEDPGPLAGVPVTVKINVDQAGFATTNGTRLQEKLIAQFNSPAVDNLQKAGAILLGRSNSSAFALRWFTSNLVHGRTVNPRNPKLTPGGSSGGAAAAVAAGIGQLALGTDIGGSVRYPAYACGVHGLRPTLGRVPAFNASSPERAIGAQLMSAAGPIARTIADLRVGLLALSAPDLRDPWYVPLPLEGRAVPLRAALCLRPGGLRIAPEVEHALRDAAERLVDAGWSVEEIDDTPSLREAEQLQERLWLGDGFDALVDSVTRDGDPAALAVVSAARRKVQDLPADVISQSLVRRTTLTRQWRLFLDQYAVVLMPVSAELPFPDDLDQQGLDGFDRVWEAQLTMRALPAMGLPGLAVTTQLIDGVPVGVQIVAAHYREDLCLLAGEAIEARGVPKSPVDPRV
ncbi:amidase family protein [Paraburkholderia sp. MMS20-SJTR3]|uniref:Amidase family protein n=1 Tax=Paraburkholderia sejongensis TaxID=2886946 RepID=A0ABS8JQR4_9BURK|nr:amidase family protein [Paraburkholderia sp. MMS20-SJTR3]MCC8392157.1 amidase family protein [Paraburkholderia sp. MMS20-SJTR3]